MITETLELKTVPTAEPGRRGFLAAAAGLTLGFFLPVTSRLGEMEAATGQINSWLTIGANNAVTLTIGPSEMGQGSFSGLAQIAAEDLMVDYASIVTVQGSPTLASPAPLGTSISTAGSSIIRNNFWKMRDAAAAAREMLVQAAMNAKGDQTRANYAVSNAVITHKSGATWTYGQVASAAALLAPPVGAALVPDTQFRVIGKTMPRFDIPSKTDGSAIYGIDVRLPNMVYAAIKHCPTFGGTLAGAPRVPGGAFAVVPTKVIAGTDRGADAVGNVNAVAVVATNTWDAWQGVNSLHLTWNLPANASTLNDANFLAQAQALATSARPYVVGGANPAGTLYTVEGNAAAAAAAIATAAKTIDSTYTLPYVSHACMEVLNCTVNYVPGVSCDIYAPTQSAKSILSLASTLTGLTPDRITVHTTYLGGGLGRKIETDFVSQAIQIAMAVNKPVKLFWPREEDFTHDQYRPMGLVHVKAGLDSADNITGWSFRNISPSILSQRGSVLPATGDSQGYEAANALPYRLGSLVTEYVSHPSPIPVGFWRSVGASINIFAAESMVDELAFAAGRDPYLFRRALLTDPRWIAVLDAAATLGGWNTPLQSGHGRGIAIGTSFNSIVAEVVEVSNVTATSLTVSKASIALDCYLSVNPGQIEAQLIGGMVHGMNAALYGRQNFVNGVAQHRNFSQSRMIRAGEMPQVSVTLIPNPTAASRTISIGGVGELGVPAFAPALANAVFKATGKRVRTLPFFPNATMSD